MITCKVLNIWLTAWVTGKWVTGILETLILLTGLLFNKYSHADTFFLSDLHLSKAFLSLIRTTTKRKPEGHRYYSWNLKFMSYALLQCFFLGTECFS